MDIYSYVYRLDHPVTGEFYIGFRTANTVRAKEDFGSIYFTSSKYVKPRFHEFDYYIIAEFFNSDDAYTFEQSLIEENWGDPLLLNKHFERNGKFVFTNKGGTVSEETKLKISNTLAGRPRSEETKLKISNTLAGRPRSEETKLKLSNSLKGKPKSKQAIEKSADAKRGIPRSEETKRKISEAQRGKPRKPQSEETKRKRSESIKAYWAARKALVT